MKGLRLLLGLITLCGTVAASQIPAGILTWDVNFPGNAGQFDITNFTGPNSSAPDFPITTTLNLASLSLDVIFVGGGSTVFGSSYFSLDIDGESLDGTAIPIGGTNPEPVSATLTGTFSPTSILDPGPDTIVPSFSVSFSDTPFLVDGDFGIINATEATSTPGTPEPGTTVLLAGGLLALLCMKYRRLAKGILPALLLCLAAGHSAFAQAVLPALTTPSSGVAGVNNVSVLASHIPAGTLTPANVIATFASTCGGTAVTTESINSIRNILGSTDRFNLNLPITLTTGNYFVSLADSAGGEADFTSTGCSEVQVTASSAVLNACVAGSSMGVLLPANGATGNVTAYVPEGDWSSSTTGVFVQNIEGTAAPAATVATANVPNSCSSNPATGQTVCVANNTDVYLISGTTLTNTLTSGANSSASFSGGSCNNCGVAVNANNNTAVINMGLTGSIDGGLQVLNLATNTFGTPLPLIGADVSENISVDPTRSLVLSAGEGGNYTIAQIQANGSLLEYDSSFGTGVENDSSAEDCSTGVAITPGEFTNSVGLVNMNAITFTAGTPGTYTAPNALATLATSYSFSAGLSGSAVAQGSGHLAVVTGEFGGNTFAVLKLPAAAGSATPALADYAVAAIPANDACGGTFSAGFDPHTITAYTSPNTGDSYAVFAGYISGVPACLALVDMTTVINPTLSPRGGGGLSPNDVAAADLPVGAVTFFPL
jgi:hypothetical protein